MAEDRAEDRADDSARDGADEKAGAAATGAPPTTGGTSGRSWSWLLPALAFVAGVALGALVVGVGTLGDDAGSTSASGVTASPTAEPDPEEPRSSADVIVRVPGACLEAADGAEEAARQVDDVADAVRAFDARRLQELVDRFQQLQPEVQRLADRCRELSGGRLQEGTLVTPEAVPTPTP